MIKKSIILFIIAIIALTLVGCSPTTPVIQNEPQFNTAPPVAIYNVGETARVDSTSFVIRKSQRVDATIDKAHVVYAIYIVIHNYEDRDISINPANIHCYAGTILCENYTGLGELPSNITIAPNGTIEGWIYYKIPAMHDGLSFTYTYNEGTYILFVFEEG